MSKRLIINADDYGMSEKSDRRIIESYARGAITDISILAVGDSFDHAVKLAKDKQIEKIGIHLALTGKFIVKDKFSSDYRSFLIKYLAGCVKTDELYHEFKSQITMVKKSGFKITHLDSHEHIHMLPGVLKSAIRVMKEFGIESIRFPLEKLAFVKKLKGPRMWLRNAMLSGMCAVSRKTIEASGLKHTDNFIGHARALNFAKKDFLDLASRLKDGVTELCCHPGNREEEANALCDNGFREELKKHSIELISF